MIPNTIIPEIQDLKQTLKYAYKQLLENEIALHIAAKENDKIGMAIIQDRINELNECITDTHEEIGYLLEG